MPSISPQNLQENQCYVIVRKTNLHGSRSTKKFVGRNPQGWPRFHTGHGATNTPNPELMNFYSPTDSTVPVPRAGETASVSNECKPVAPAAAIPNSVAPAAAGVGGKRKSTRATRKVTKKNKQRKRK